MTICTQQSEVSFVSCPISKTTMPSPLAFFRPFFLCAVNMVDVQYAGIVYSAFAAFSAKLVNQCQFTFPITLSFMLSITLTIPICFSTNRITESCIGFFLALAAIPVMFPPVGKIASRTAILSCSIPKSIGMYGCRFPAVLTDNDGWFCSHSCIITIHRTCSELKYFDIACRRIEEANGKGSLFEDVEPAQAEMFS